MLQVNRYIACGNACTRSPYGLLSQAARTRHHGISLQPAACLRIESRQFTTSNSPRQAILVSDEMRKVLKTYSETGIVHVGCAIVSV
jgi:hypothetical protein